MLCYKVIRYFFMMPNKAHLHYSPQVKESIINRDICASEIRGSVLVEHLPEIDDLRDRVIIFTRSIENNIGIAGGG